MSSFVPCKVFFNFNKRIAEMVNALSALLIRIIIPADDVIRLFEIEDKKQAYLLAKEFNLLDRSPFDITIQYLNLYHTQWMVNGETPLPQTPKHVD